MTDRQDPIAAVAEAEAMRVARGYIEIKDRDYFELAMLHAALDAVTVILHKIQTGELPAPAGLSPKGADRG